MKSKITLLVVLFSTLFAHAQLEFEGKLVIEKKQLHGLTSLEREHILIIDYYLLP